MHESNVVCQHFHHLQEARRLEQEPAVRMYYEAAKLAGLNAEEGGFGCFGCDWSDRLESGREMDATRYSRMLEAINTTLRNFKVDIPRLVASCHSNLVLKEDGGVDLVKEHCFMDYQLFQKAAEHIVSQG